MRLRHVVLAPAVVLAVAACASGGSSPSASVDASSPPIALASVAADRINVALSDDLRMDPAQVAVKAGQPVTFVVTNTGAIQHEFFLGDEAAQAAHEEEMMAMGGMQHDEPDGIAVQPGETKELTHTFAKAGAYTAGCHVTGHYDAGMKVAITVTE